MRLFILFLLLFTGNIIPACANESHVQAANIHVVNPSSSHNSSVSQNIGSLRFLVSSEFPPFSFLDIQGEIDGFYIALARSMCKELKARCTMQAVPWSEIEGRLMAKEADIALSGLSINTDALQEFDFSIPFMPLPARFIARKDGTILNAAKVGVIVGSTHERFLRQYFPKLNVFTFDHGPDSQNALRDSDIDILFGDGLLNSFWLQSERANGCCEFIGDAYYNREHFGAGHSFSMPKGRVRLKEQLDEVLHSLAANGELTKLYLTYFPIDFLNLGSPVSHSGGILN